MIPKLRKRPKMMVKEPTVIRAPGFLAFVRRHNCTCVEIDPTGCGGEIEAAHVRRGTDGGIGMKPSDCYALPLCSEHHAEQHRIGEQSFEKKYRFAMRQVADRLWKMWTTGTEAGRKWMQEQARKRVLPSPTPTPVSEVTE
jgi:hypothetical protein